MGNPLEMPDLPPVPQPQQDITAMPMPLELTINQAHSGFEFVDNERFFLTFTVPTGIRYKIFFDEQGWENLLNAKIQKKSGIVIAR